MQLIFRIILIATFLLSCSGWLFDELEVEEKQLQVNNLRAVNCGNESDAFQLEKIEISNVEDGGLDVSFRAKTTKNITSPVKLQYNIQRKAPLGWKKLPFSGSMRDVCALGTPRGQECPERLRELNLPCRCPIEKDTELVVEKTFEIPEQLSLIKNMLKGQYKTIIFASHNGERLACYDVSFNVDLK